MENKPAIIVSKDCIKQDRHYGHSIGEVRCPACARSLSIFVFGRRREICEVYLCEVTLPVVAKLKVMDDF